MNQQMHIYKNVQSHNYKSTTTGSSQKNITVTSGNHTMELLISSATTTFRNKTLQQRTSFVPFDVHVIVHRVKLLIVK